MIYKNIIFISYKIAYNKKVISQNLWCLLSVSLDK